MHFGSAALPKGASSSQEHTYMQISRNCKKTTNDRSRLEKVINEIDPSSHSYQRIPITPTSRSGFPYSHLGEDTLQQCVPKLLVRISPLHDLLRADPRMKNLAGKKAKYNSATRTIHMVVAIYEAQPSL